MTMITNTKWEDNVANFTHGGLFEDVDFLVKCFVFFL